MRLSLNLSIALLTTGLTAFSTLGAGSDDPLISEQTTQMKYIENGDIRLGIDLSIGGSITYLADTSKDINLINGYDWGRQVQMSFYSGPQPFEPEGNKPHPNWASLGWNPIQSGDAYENQSKTMEFSSDGQSLYVKCIPMHWPLENEPGHCTFETWVQLEGPIAHIRSRLVNNRKDRTQYEARAQELPAVYTNAPWHRLVTYTGAEPFTQGALEEIPKQETHPDIFPWSYFKATENWAALLDEQDDGLGVYSPGATKFIGGFAGEPGAGGPKDNPTGYVSPLHDEILDHNIVYDYEYQLIVGSLDDIRAHVYREHTGPMTCFDFSSTRQHWTYVNATDQGWPIDGQLEVALTETDAEILSPWGFWNLSDYSHLEITAGFDTGQYTAAIKLLPFGAVEESGGILIPFDIQSDGIVRTYQIPLQVSQLELKKGIIQFGLVPSNKEGDKHSVTINRIQLIPHAK